MFLISTIICKFSKPIQVRLPLWPINMSFAGSRWFQFPNFNSFEPTQLHLYRLNHLLLLNSGISFALGPIKKTKKKSQKLKTSFNLFLFLLLFFGQLPHEILGNAYINLTYWSLFNICLHLSNLFPFAWYLLLN